MRYRVIVHFVAVFQEFLCEKFRLSLYFDDERCNVNEKQPDNNRFFLEKELSSGNLIRVRDDDSRFGKQFRSRLNFI